MQRDQFDELLLHCTSDPEALDRAPRTPAEAARICRNCGEDLKHNFRFCSNCSLPTFDLDEEENPYSLPIRQRGQHFEVTILGIEQDVTDGEAQASDLSDGDDHSPRRGTEVRLRITNLGEERLCVSLTFAQSALVDITGRQYFPQPRDRDDHESGANLDRWFYLYPRAHVEGTLHFPDIPAALWHCYLSAQPQDREEDLFHFTLR
ncbi:MAG TPA: hypothetical protein VEI97_16910 [bacterium]|nr:hypothetical protein [bacterium]